MSDDPLIGFSDESLIFEQQLGKGAMGAVYKGTQVRLNRPVAIKVIAKHLAADPAYVERFNREAQTMGRLSHPNVIACHDFGSAQGPEGELLVMILEFVDGWSLGALAKERKLTVRQVVELHRQAAEGLAAANALGIVHRDIKPDNLMVTRQGQVKLADFGLAKAEDSVMVTQTGAIVGSPAFMSPEAARGEDPTHLGDCYSLACSLFALLAGAPPYMSNSALNVLHQHASSPIPSLAERGRADLASLFDPFFAKAMAKDPAERFADSHAMALALRELANTVPPQIFAGAGRGSEELGGLSADAATKTTGDMATIATRQPSDPKPAGRRRSSPSNPRARSPRSGEHARHRGGGKQMQVIVGLAALGILLLVGLIAVVSGGGATAPPPTPAPVPAATTPPTTSPALSEVVVPPAPPEPQPAALDPSPPAATADDRAARLAEARSGIESQLGIVVQLMTSGQLGRAETALGLISVPEHIDFQDLRDHKVNLGDLILRHQREAVVTAQRQLDAVEAALEAGDAARARALLDGLQVPAHPRFERLTQDLANPSGPESLGQGTQPVADPGQPTFPLIPTAPATPSIDGPMLLPPQMIQAQVVHPLEDQVPGSLPYELPDQRLWRSVLDRDGRSQLMALELPVDGVGATLQLVVHAGFAPRELHLIAPRGDHQIASIALDSGWQAVSVDLAELPPGNRGLLLLAAGQDRFHLAQAGLAPPDAVAITLSGGTLLDLRTAGGPASAEALMRRMWNGVQPPWRPHSPTVIAPGPGGRDDNGAMATELTALVERCYRKVTRGGVPIRAQVTVCRSSAESSRAVDDALEARPGLLLLAFEAGGITKTAIRQWSTFAREQTARGILPVLVLLPDGDEAELDRRWRSAIDDIRESDPELPVIDTYRALGYADQLGLAWRDDDVLRRQLVLTGIEAGLHELLWRLSQFAPEQGGLPPDNGGIGFPE